MSVLSDSSDIHSPSMEYTIESPPTYTAHHFRVPLCHWPDPIKKPLPDQREGLLFPLTLLCGVPVNQGLRRDFRSLMEFARFVVMSSRANHSSAQSRSSSQLSSAPGMRMIPASRGMPLRSTMTPPDCG